MLFGKPDSPQHKDLGEVGDNGVQAIRIRVIRSDHDHAGNVGGMLVVSTWNPILWGFVESGPLQPRSGAVFNLFGRILPAQGGLLSPSAKHKSE